MLFGTVRYDYVITTRKIFIFLPLINDFVTIGSSLFVTSHICNMSSNTRSSHQRYSIKTGVLKNFVNFTGKHLCQRVFLIKKRLWHRCSPVNFAKFLRTPFYRAPLNDCF